jgi:hypothetical protein
MGNLMSKKDNAYEEAMKEYNEEQTFKTLSRISFKEMVRILRDPNVPWKFPLDKTREKLLNENGWTVEEYIAELNRRIFEAQNDQ